MIKKLAIALVILILLVGAAGYYLFLSLDGIIKNAVEKYGAAATLTDVQLNSVQLALSTGEGTLSGLTVGNPKGFAMPKAFYLGSIAVHVDTGSIRGNDPVIISAVTIDQPQVTYELLNNGDSNLQTIQNNTEAYAKSFQGRGANNPAEPAPDKGPVKTADGQSRKIIINDLVIKNGQVSISQEMLKGRQLSVPLPVIHLTNIGKSTGGATAGQLAEQILGSITSAASQASVTELAKDKISGLINAVPAKAIGGAAADTVNGAVKNLFGN